MEFMPNEYKLFLLESILLSAIFTACCSSGSNTFHQEVYRRAACRPIEGEEIPRRLFGLKYSEWVLSLFIQLQMDKKNCTVYKYLELSAYL